MSDEGSVTDLIRQLELGDEEAARLLWQRYFHRLVDFARRRLGTTHCGVADEEDVALSVFRCLWGHATRGKLSELEGRQELWRLLVVMTTNKAIDQQRRSAKLKRGGGKLLHNAMQGDEGEEAVDFGVELAQVMDDQPTPEVQAMIAEGHRRLMALLGDERLRQIAQWKLEGYTNEEIASRLGLATRSIERKLRQIRHVWAQEVDL